MRRLLTSVIAVVLLLTIVGCRRYIYRPPVLRPVEYVPDSLVHDDIPKAEDESQQMLNDIEDESVMVVPDIPQESDLMQEENRNVNIEKIMKEGI